MLYNYLMIYNNLYMITHMADIYYYSSNNTLNYKQNILKTMNNINNYQDMINIVVHLKQSQENIMSMYMNLYKLNNLLLDILYILKDLY